MTATTNLIPIEPILIIDDDLLIAEALKQTLERQGYKTKVAHNGVKAIELLNSQIFSVVICDQKLPGIPGCEVLRFAEEKHPNTIRIALTGSTDLSLISNAVNVGQATLFVTKPWDDVSLSQLIANGIERFRLLQENQRLNNLIINQHKELEENHAILNHELKLSAHIHEELLLGKVPNDIPYTTIVATTLPSREIDGDFYDFFPLSDQLLDIVIGDVMGKGIPAALVGTALKREFEHFAMPFANVKFCRDHSGWEDTVLSPKEILDSVHQKMGKSLLNLEYFATLFYGRFDFVNQTLTFAKCGFPHPIHFNKATGTIQFLQGDNFPLGITLESHYEESKIQWQIGDFFLFYSDGITESRSPDGEFFGIERLVDLVMQHSHDKPHMLVKIITDAIVHFVQKERFDDDVTLALMKMQAFASDSTLYELSSSFSSDLKQLPVVRDFVHKLCSSASGDKARLANELQLATDEAFCNIVQHGYKGSKEHAITIQGKLLPSGVRIDICDWGEEFDPSKVKLPDLYGEQETGFGLYIIRQIADQLTYFKKKNFMDKNKLCIFKRYYI